MIKLEGLQPNAAVRGIVPDTLVTVVTVQWFGSEALGYDIESRVPGTGKLCFIEVKGRVAGADTITVTRNEILYSLNKPEDFILAVVEFGENGTHRAHYLRQPFHHEPDFGVVSQNYDLAELISRAELPR